jgi:putative acyl-CoA dehydrogenase
MGADAKEAWVPDYFADASGYATHEVLNQAGALADYDAYGDDTPLVQAMKVFGASWASEVLHHAGRHVGSQKVQHLARQANRHLPELRTHDRFGNRIDVIEFHPAYHELMSLIYGTQAHSFAWTHQGRLGRASRAWRPQLHLEPGRKWHLLSDGNDIRVDTGFAA